MKSGIYQIRNIQNNHIYVGSAVNIKNRWRSHVTLLRKGKHHSRHLQSAWNKYGEGCFDFSVLEYCNKENLIVREQHYIDTRSPSYNMSPTAGNQRGVHHSEESKKKNSLANIGRTPWNKGKNGVYSDETLARMREAKKGQQGFWKNKKKSEEHKAKIGNASRNRSPEVYEKMSVARKLWWQNKKNEAKQSNLVIEQGFITLKGV